MIESDLHGDVERPAEMLARRSEHTGIESVFGKVCKVTGVSVIPCRLIGGLHEWPNESATVPAWKPVKLTLLAHSPVRNRRKRRPRRALLQPVAVVRSEMCRVGGTRRSPGASLVMRGR